MAQSEPLLYFRDARHQQVYLWTSDTTSVFVQATRQGHIWTIEPNAVLSNHTWLSHLPDNRSTDIDRWQNALDQIAESDSLGQALSWAHERQVDFVVQVREVEPNTLLATFQKATARPPAEATYAIAYNPTTRRWRSSTPWPALMAWSGLSTDHPSTLQLFHLERSQPSEFWNGWVQSFVSTPGLGRMAMYRTLTGVEQWMWLDWSGRNVSLAENTSVDIPGEESSQIWPWMTALLALLFLGGTGYMFTRNRAKRPLVEMGTLALDTHRHLLERQQEVGKRDLISAYPEVWLERLPDTLFSALETSSNDGKPDEIDVLEALQQSNHKKQNEEVAQYKAQAEAWQQVVTEKDRALQDMTGYAHATEKARAELTRRLESVTSELERQIGRVSSLEQATQTAAARVAERERELSAFKRKEQALDVVFGIGRQVQRVQVRLFDGMSNDLQTVHALSFLLQYSLFEWIRGILIDDDARQKAMPSNLYQLATALPEYEGGQLIEKLDACLNRGSIETWRDDTRRQAPESHHMSDSFFQNMLYVLGQKRFNLLPFFYEVDRNGIARRVG